MFEVRKTIQNTGIELELLKESQVKMTLKMKKINEPNQNLCARTQQ